MNQDSFRPAPSLARAFAGAPIRVGSENRAKLSAVHDALKPFAKSAVELKIVPVAVTSGVAEQPVGWDEIVCGARNRARAAFDSGDCVLAVGIEDGLVRLTDEGFALGVDPESDAVFNVGCAWITDGEREGHGFCSGFSYPPGCRGPAIRDRVPIGDLFDQLWRVHRSNTLGAAEVAASSGKGGNIGRLTEGRLERSAYGAQAVVCALVRFLHTDLYD